MRDKKPEHTHTERRSQAGSVPTAFRCAEAGSDDEAFPGCKVLLNQRYRISRLYASCQ